MECAAEFVPTMHEQWPDYGSKSFRIDMTLRARRWLTWLGGVGEAGDFSAPYTTLILVQLVNFIMIP